MRVSRLMRPSIGRGLAVLMVMGVSVLCASACAVASASMTHKSASKAPIKIFVYSDVTVPAPLPPETFQQLLPAAAVKEINATGGINGAKVQMTFCDSKFDPNDTLACVKQALSGNYAAVIVPASSVGTGGADQLLATSKLPIFYGIPNPVQIAAKNAVCVTSTIVGSGSAVGFMAKSLGLKHVGLLTAASPTFVASEKYVNSSLKKENIGVTSETTFPLGTADLSPDFAQAMSGAGGLWLANIGPELSPATVQFLQAYPSAKLIMQYLADNTLQQVGSPGNGRVYFPMWTQPLASHVAGAQDYTSDAKKYGDPSVAQSDQYIPFWLPVKLFAGIAETIQGKVTAASMLTAIKTAKDVSLGGLVPNYNGSALGKDGVPCMYQNAVVPTVDKNGRLVSTLKSPSDFLNTTTGDVFAQGS
jgi:ABC-type branched-subunit amino acid transport system substrate-binding protein